MRLLGVVGVSGRLTLLQKFPNNETYAGLHELLEEMEEDLFLDPFKEKAGLYWAYISLEQNTHYHPEYDNTCLVIDRLKPILSLDFLNFGRKK